METKVMPDGKYVQKLTWEGICQTVTSLFQLQQMVQPGTAYVLPCGQGHAFYFKWDDKGALSFIQCSPYDEDFEKFVKPWLGPLANNIVDLFWLKNNT